MAESEKRIAQLEARMAMLEKEVADLNQAYIRVINKLNQIPSAILLRPGNPAPGWIAKLRPKESKHTDLGAYPSGRRKRCRGWLKARLSAASESSVGDDLPFS